MSPNLCWDLIWPLFKQVGNIFVGSLLPRIRPWDGFVEASGAFVTVWLLFYWMYRTRTFLKL